MYLSEKELIKVLPKNQQKTLVMNPKYFDLFSDSDLLETFSEEELRGFVLSVYPSVKNRIVKILNIPIEDIYADVLQDEDNFSLVLKETSPEYMKVLNSLNEKDISNNISIKFLGNYIAGEHFQNYPINITFTDQYISEYIDNSDFEIWLKGNNLKDKSGRYLTEAEKGGIIKSSLLPENYYREHPFDNDISKFSSMSKYNTPKRPIETKYIILLNSPVSTKSIIFSSYNMFESLDSLYIPIIPL
jgi:hypothetical protein